MKFLLKNKNRKAQEPAVESKVAKGMQALYRNLQCTWATYMEKLTAKLSSGNWKIVLVLFVLLTGGYNAYLILNAFTQKEIKSFAVTPIKKPEHLTQTGDAKNGALQVSEAEYLRIRSFRIYMDSLLGSPSSKPVYDSITNNRPGLMDSVRFIENYYEQFKNK
ncbi:MAG: hypothetical protein ACYCZO_10515 [Daejeonella sp.]|uniref:hypothetical protein n=2 Tax=Chitinophagaceae TaxID=563835 RepID=UPI001026D743|nr:hypothetical protein [Hydrotalea sp. AMD]RWZ89407.1 MAG: hypothetical protein EO766_04200 [Hydrotalea sp. AMD]HQS33990.1 hypothetical protein [Sediminibacterium sp.]